MLGFASYINIDSSLKEKLMGAKITIEIVVIRSWTSLCLEDDFIYLFENHKYYDVIEVG